ncbi:InlB B-repeat-containing protein, partial [Candidatus Saccharibacteria bacterium]|nr:InlB B-repeat-containing protein [Candidatus Saccharibacteria bacterium]
RNYIKNFRRIRILGSASLFSLGLLLLATFVPLYNVTRTEDTEAAAGTTKDSSITFTATRSTASVDLTVTDENGTFASSTDGTNGTTDTRAAFSISTTNFTGYTLTIASNDNTSALTNTNGGSLSSISESISESTFNTTAYNNKWGYKPSCYGSSANSNYLPSPTTTASTLDETDVANTTAKNYTIALGARADYTNASGTYSSSNYKLMYVANPVAYSITYADNSGDSTVANIPAVQSSDSVTTSTIVLTSATPTRTGYSFKSWCLGTVSNSGTSCTGTEYASGVSFGIDRTANKASNTATLTAIWTANKYTCTKQYRLQNADGSWGNYTTDTTEQVAYNSTCSYSKTVTNYKGSETGTNGTAATASKTMNSTSGITVQVSLYRNTFTCSKRYRLQNADGNYPSSYTSVTGETIRYGATCSYSQSYTNYQTQSTSATITAATTLSLDLPRNTYALTVTAGSNTSSATGGGTYRWGQTVTVGVTKASNTTCITYSAPTWSRTSGSGTLNATSGTSVTFTMTTSNATVTATSSSTRKTYTISYNANGGTGTTSSTTGNCGANSTLASNGFSRTNYSFLGWSTSSTATTASYNAGTAYNLGERTSNLTLYAVWKDNRTYMQDLTLAACQKNVGTNGNAANIGDNITVYDKRDGKDYTVRYINGYCWMTQNLRFTGTSVPATTSNVTTDKTLTYYSLNSSDAGGFGAYSGHCDDTNGYNYACIYDSGSTTTGVWYNYYAATASTISTNSNNTAASQDICPKNWHIPTGPSDNSSSESYKFFNSTSTGWFAANDYLTAFGAVAGGYYYNNGSTRGSTNYGEWWTATAPSLAPFVAQRYYFGYDSSNGMFNSGNFHYRWQGRFVRCVRTS